MLRIVTDSISSISKERAQELGIDIISLYLNIDGVEYKDADMDLESFNAQITGMVDNPPTSSQPSALDFEGVFSEIAQAGDEMIGVFASSKMSGTYEGALRAASLVAQETPFKYCMIDSTSNCYDEAFAVFEAARLRNEGADFDTCVKAILDTLASTRFIFSPESLTFLQKGGRIGGARALIGNLISIAPILTVADGTAQTKDKVRTQKRALKRMVEIVQEDIKASGSLKNLAVGYIGDKEPAIKWAKEVIEPTFGITPEVVPASPVIGLHVGPSLALVYQCSSPLKDKITCDLSELVAYSSEA